MPAWPKTRRSAAAFAAACLAGLLAATVAVAAITVYTNGFSRQRAVKDLDLVGSSKPCDKHWREAQKSVEITVQRGSASCAYRLPVRGDSDLPDHILKAKMRVLKDTPKSVREDAFVAVSLRVNSNVGYELRVFPRGGRFELRRQPAGAPFPMIGTDAAIKKIGEKNVLELRAIGDQVKAFVNGTKVAQLTDPDAADVGGRNIEVTVGNTKDSTLDVIATVDDIRIACPNHGC